MQLSKAHGTLKNDSYNTVTTVTVTKDISNKVWKGGGGEVVGDSYWVLK